MAKEKKSPKTLAVPSAFNAKIELGLLVALMAVFYAHARHFEFIQDDSFITFRYIKNFVEGHGLVFNYGERVEGYTTFLWTILLALPAKAGFDLVSSSQNIGILFGLASFFIIYRMSKSLASVPRHWSFSLMAVAFMTANGAAAYWTISGMETAMFMFLTLLSVWMYLRERSQPKLFAYTPLVFVLLSFTRPEGMFLFALTMLYSAFELLRNKGANRAVEIKRIVVWSALYAIPTTAFMAWRYSYYGWFFPNTYYAKVGISSEYFSAGLDYFTMFAKNYLLYGVALLFPLLLLIRRKWKSDILFLFYIVITYTTYIITVGGDVLPVFRFFIPILPLIYLLVQESLHEFFLMMESKRSALKHLAFVVPVAFAYITYSTPYDYIRDYWMKENGLVAHMTDLGNWIKSKSSPNTVIAASTIGAISYYSDITLIDMLGLTDETIAHEPEKIFGVKSGWRERNYNTSYVLSRKPDWICFSTGIKPSAFAERALFTREEFRKWYYPYYFHPTGDANDVSIMYKRSAEPMDFDSVALARKKVDFDFINNYYDGVNRVRRWPQEAIQYFTKSLAQAPPDFALLYQDIAGLYRQQNNIAEAVRYYQKAVHTDPRMIESQLILGMMARDQKDYAKALSHFKEAARYDPDYTVCWTLLGEAHLAAGDMPSARAALQKALDVTSNNSQAYADMQRIGGQR